MPKPNYPWPAGSFTYPYWRNRHIMSGDFTPPSLPSGTADTIRRIPFSETGPTGGEYGGAYDTEARLVGYGESLNSSSVNRAAYSIQSGLDMLAEKDDASPTILPQPMGAGTSLVGGNNELDPGVVVVYLGPEGTTATTGTVDSCSHFLKVWTLDTSGPLLTASLAPHVVVDVLAKSNGSSLYTALPATADIYPRGVPGTLTSVVLTAVQFLSNVAPDGTPALPLSDPVPYFNYSLFERIQSGVTAGSFSDVFATMLSAVAGPPDTYTLSRDVAALDWRSGDRIYTTHFAYQPILCMADVITGPADYSILCGTFASSTLGETQRFMNLLRLGGTGVVPFPFEVSEPVGATYGSFDYANALLRVVDGTLRGTVGLDIRGAGNHSLAQQDMYAGVLHRKEMYFNNATTTNVPPGSACNCSNAARTVTLLGGETFFDTATLVAPYDDSLSHMIPYVDLLEITDAIGNKYLLVYTGANNPAANNTVVNCLDLAGGTAGIPTLVGGTSTVTIYRPIIRTGIWACMGSDTQFGGNAFTGDYWKTAGLLLPQDIPSIRLFSGGASNLMEGYDTPTDNRTNGTGGSNGMTWAVSATGDITQGLETSGLITEDTRWYQRTRLRGNDFTAPAYDFYREHTTAHTASTHGVAYFREVAEMYDAAPYTMGVASFRVSPTDSNGVSQPTSLDKVKTGAVLLLGDPEIPWWATASTSTNPNYGGVYCGQHDFNIGGAATNRLMSALFIQRDRDNVGGNTSFPVPDLYAAVVEGSGARLAPFTASGDSSFDNGPYNRLELPYHVIGSASRDRTMNFGWSTARTYTKQVNLADGIAHSDNTGVWKYQRVSAGTPPIWYIANGVINVVDRVDIPVHLPPQASITEIKIRYNMADADDRGFVADILCFNPGYTGGAVVAPALVGGDQILSTKTSTGGWATATKGAVGMTFDPAYTYVIRLYSPYDASANPELQVAGIFLTYTLSDLNPDC